MRLALESEELGRGTFVIAPAGELDLYTCPELEKELLRVIADGAVHVVVDLSATTFLDSTALGVLLRTAERLRTQNGHLALVSADATTSRIFEVTGLARIFELHPSRADALAKIDAA